MDNPYEAPKVTLLQTVAQANRCRTVWLRDLGLVTVIGFPPDLDAAELLFTSLLVQANSAMLRAGGAKDAWAVGSRAFRQSFLVSYAVRIGERLAEAAGQAERRRSPNRPAAPGAGPRSRAGRRKDLVPFLAARHRAVDDAVDAMFGGALTGAGRCGWTTPTAGTRPGRGRPGPPARPHPGRVRRPAVKSRTAGQSPGPEAKPGGQRHQHTRRSD